jgi:uncharacterized protein YndB with AHSA1/START domain
LKASITVETHFSAPRERVFQVFAEDSAFTAFPGSWPIPGISQLVHLSGDGTQAGDRLLMKNSDGTSHEEIVVAYEPGRLMQLKVGPFHSPLSLLVKEGVDQAEFLDEANGHGSRLRQSFSFEAKSFFVFPLVWLLGRMCLARAVTKHHQIIAHRVGAPSKN